jgi:hypothetical protein
MHHHSPTLAHGSVDHQTRVDIADSSSNIKQQERSSIFSPVTNFWRTNISPSMKNWPKIQCRVEPTTTLKLRKTFCPLGTIFRLGADFNTQLGVWQFRSSWETINVHRLFGCKKAQSPDERWFKCLQHPLYKTKMVVLVDQLLVIRAQWRREPRR